MRKMREMVAAVLAALAVASCSDQTGTALTSPNGAAPRLAFAAYVQVCCPKTAFQGAQYQVYAEAYDINSQRISNPVVAWSTSGNGVAVIYGSSEAAVVQAVGVGQTTIYANIDGVIASTTLTVLAPPAVNSVQFVSISNNLMMGYNSQSTAKAYDQYGNVMNGVTFSWSSSNTGVATVSSSGVITPVAPGTTTITVSAGGKAATAQVTIIPQISLSFSGPNTIWTSGIYQWDVQASGGTGSYTYQWYVDYAWGSSSQPLSSSDATILNVDENTGPFIMRVAVTSGGVTVEAGTMVCNFIAGAHC